MPERDEVIWIMDAATEYGRSRKWLDEQIEAGKLSVAQIPGDKKVYLLRPELDALLRPKIIKPADGQQQAG